jgi:hypothetical protein
MRHKVCDAIAFCLLIIAGLGADDMSGNLEEIGARITLVLIAAVMIYAPYFELKAESKNLNEEE